MSDLKLPELPEPVAYFLKQDSAPPMWDQVAARYSQDADVFALYSKDDMLAIRDSGIAYALELAAQIAERHYIPGHTVAGPHFAARCAAAIRAKATTVASNAVQMPV
jgi:hypothetical protein